jgi:hypothetical protein
MAYAHSIDPAVAAPFAGTLRPALLWRPALDIVCRRLAEAGLAEEEAVERGEGALIVCVLRHEPRTLEDAIALLTREAGLAPAGGPEAQPA